MAKIFDYILIACAIVAGAVLFAFGTRQIFKRARSPRMTRFLLYVSIVLVFLGGKLGTHRTAAAEPEDPRAAAVLNIGLSDYSPEFLPVIQLWKHIHELKAADLDKEKFAAELAAADKTLAVLDEFVNDQKMLV
jgi:hypothetical protein